MGQPSADKLLAYEQAVEATSLWLLGQYDDALQTLQKLEGLVAQDSKVCSPLQSSATLAQPLCLSMTSQTAACVSLLPAHDDNRVCPFRCSSIWQ